MGIVKGFIREERSTEMTKTEVELFNDRMGELNKNLEEVEFYVKKCKGLWGES